MKISLTDRRVRLTALLSALAVAAIALVSPREMRAEQAGARCYMNYVCTNYGTGCYGDLCYNPGTTCCPAQNPCVTP